MLILILVSIAGLSSHAHEGGDFGSIECEQKRGGFGSSRASVTLKQVGRSRQYDIRVTETRKNGSLLVLASEISRVTVRDGVAVFKGRKTEATIALYDADRSSLKIGFRQINLSCESICPQGP